MQESLQWHVSLWLSALVQGRGCFCPPPLSALSFCTNTNIHAEPGNPGPFEFCVSVSSPYSTTWQKVVLKYSLNWACSITMPLGKRCWSKAIDWYLIEWMTIINSYVNTWTAVKHNFSISRTLLRWNYRSMYTKYVCNVHLFLQVQRARSWRLSKRVSISSATINDRAGKNACVFTFPCWTLQCWGSS